MIFNEEFIVEAPQHEAWNFLTDFPAPVEVLPGLLEIKEIAPHQYQGAVKVGIGFFHFHFQGNLNVSLIDPENYRVNINGNAHDQHLGAHFSAVAYTQTHALGPRRSRITLEVRVGLGGLLGKLGMFVLRPVAHQVVQSYAELVNEALKRRRVSQQQAVNLTKNQNLAAVAS